MGFYMKHLHGQVMHRNRKPQIYCTSAFRIRFFVSLHFPCLVHIKQKQILTGVHWFPSFQNTPPDWQNFQHSSIARKIMNFYCFLIILKNLSQTSILSSLMNILNSGTPVISGSAAGFSLSGKTVSAGSQTTEYGNWTTGSLSVSASPSGIGENNRNPNSGQTP